MKNQFSSSFWQIISRKSCRSREIYPSTNLSFQTICPSAILLLILVWSAIHLLSVCHPFWVFTPGHCIYLEIRKIPMEIWSIRAWNYRYILYINQHFLHKKTNFNWWFTKPRIWCSCIQYLSGRRREGSEGVYKSCATLGAQQTAQE